MYTNNLVWVKGRAVLLAALLLLPVACKRPQAMLEISPASGCLDSPKTALQVTWDVRPLGLEESSIEVNSLGVPPKLWLREGAAGSKLTGAWALDGFTVTLRTYDGSQILARRTFVQHVCEAEPG